MSTLPQTSPTEVAQVREQWLDAVGALLGQAQEWAEHQGWTVTEEPCEVREEWLGTYRTTSRVIDTPRGRLVLEPIARDVLGAEGRVDYYAWPTLFRVKLLRSADGTWIVRTDSGLNWPHPWQESTFVELSEGLLAEP